MYYYYRIASMTLRSSLELQSFKTFSCDAAEADVTIEETEKIPVYGEKKYSGRISRKNASAAKAADTGDSAAETRITAGTTIRTGPWYA